MAWLTTRPVARIAGCTIPWPPRVVPTKPGVLVVMNHQSLLDIPLVVQTVADGGYPRIVTRQRYARWIPLISHMVRLYRYPVVNPSGTKEEIRRSLEQIGELARESDVPLAVFPEGSRTKDGEIARFKRGALATILTTRSWTVYVFVADGFWRAAKYKDFLHNVRGVRGKVAHVGVFEWTDPGADPEPFIASRIDETSTLVQNAIITPAREGLAIMAAVKATLGALRAGADWRRRTSRSEEEDPLFIG